MDFRRKSALIFAVVLAAISLLLILVPTGFQRAIYVNAEGAKARVLAVDDSGMIQTGLFRQGDQRCTVMILSGEHRGLVMDGVNMLTGSLADDKVFRPGDTAWVLVERGYDGVPVFINLIDHYRLGKEAAAAVIFAAVMIAFSHMAGAKTVISFMFAFLAIWKMLVPLSLKGLNPIAVSMCTLMLVTAVTLLLAGGISARSLAAIAGSLISSVLTALIGWAMTEWFMIHGSVLDMSESLLYSGFQDLDLTALYIGVVALSAGGAIMDLSIDVSIAMSEVADHAESIDKKELMRSGMAVGRAGIGTQTTTLLLAYMGSWLSVMMVYMAQGTPVLNILTSKMIAAEIAQTITGCAGLILVTPITAFAASFLYCRR